MAGQSRCRIGRRITAGVGSNPTLRHPPPTRCRRRQRQRLNNCRAAFFAVPARHEAGRQSHEVRVGKRSVFSASCSGHRTAKSWLRCGTRPRLCDPSLPPRLHYLPCCRSRALSPKRQAGKHPRSAASGDEESDTTGGGASPPATAASGSFISLTGRAGSRSRYRTRRRRSSQPPVRVFSGSGAGRGAWLA